MQVHQNYNIIMRVPTYILLQVGRVYYNEIV